MILNTIHANTKRNKAPMLSTGAFIAFVNNLHFLLHMAICICLNLLQSYKNRQAIVCNVTNRSQLVGKIVSKRF